MRDKGNISVVRKLELSHLVTMEERGRPENCSTVGKVACLGTHLWFFDFAHVRLQEQRRIICFDYGS